jgi:hypothetical protein
MQYVVLGSIVGICPRDVQSTEQTYLSQHSDSRGVVDIIGYWLPKGFGL